MSLLSLPNELLQNIVDASFPDGFESLAMTCSRLYDLSKPQINSHNQLKKLYTSVDCDYETKRAHTYGLIHRIWTLPVAAQYVKRASFGMGGQSTIQDTENQKLDWPTVVNQCLQNPYIQRAMDFEKATYTRHYEEQRRNRMLERKSGPDVAVLLTLFPNVESLAIKGYNWKVPSVQFFLINATMHQIARDAIAGLCHPLSNLRTVLINPSTHDFRQGFPVHYLAPFIALPSLERLTAYLVYRKRRDYWWPDGHQSNLRTFELFDTLITAAELQEILRPMCQLRSFRYVHGRYNVASISFLDTAGYLRSLIDCVGSTLEELTFTGDFRYHTAFGSFKAFQRLTRLETRVSLLWNGITAHSKVLPERPSSESEEIPECLPQESLPCPRLIDILPTTLEDLILWFDRHVRHTNRLFEGFPTHKQILPNLQRLNIVVEQDNDPLESTLRELRSAGLEVVVDTWYNPLRGQYGWDSRGRQTSGNHVSPPPEAFQWATSPSD
ncbi:MAG: hypothetical protein Q9226_002401 [Calogaya cf. arnoldii]